MVLVPTLSNLNRSSEAVPVAPPPNFRTLGPIERTTIRSSGAQGAVGMTAAQKAGLRYESRAQDHLQQLFGPNYLVAPRLNVEIRGGKSRLLIPDGVYIAGKGLATVFEIKATHCPESWWQLRELYERALRAVDLVHHVNLIEVCKSFDPSQPYPEPVVRLESVTPRVFAESRQYNIGVYVWR